MVPKKCSALVNIKTVVSVRKVASGGGATDVGRLPNITGVNAVQFTPSCTGAITRWSGSMGNVVAGDWASGVPSYLNASASSSVFSKSSTVQPASVRLLPCIKA